MSGRIPPGNFEIRKIPGKKAEIFGGPSGRCLGCASGGALCRALASLPSLQVQASSMQAGAVRFLRWCKQDARRRPPWLRWSKVGGQIGLWQGNVDWVVWFAERSTILPEGAAGCNTGARVSARRSTMTTRQHQGVFVNAWRERVRREVIRCRDLDQ